MRLAEICLVLVVAFGWVQNPRTFNRRRWAVVVLLVGALHLLLEGPRLPMVPAYAIAALFLIRALMWRRPAVGEPTARSAPRAVGAGLSFVVLLALAGLPPYLLPVFRLPTPSGPFGIGGSVFAVVDSSREEVFAPDHQKTQRTFPVRIWYPAAKGATGQRAVYATAAEVASPLLKILSPTLAAQYRYVKTHTILDAPLATREAPFPVLIFSHGYTGYSAQNTPQMEELASRGYVVFSIGHTYDAAAAVFPDGRTVALDPTIIKILGGAVANGDSVRNATTAKIEAIARAGTSVDRQARFKDYMKTNPERINQSVPVWSADTRYLLDYLERSPQAAPIARFAGKLDFAKIGIFGMSFGGSNAGEVCRADPRCKAGINIDGQQFGQLIDDSLTVPFMIMASDIAIPLHTAIVDRLRGPGYLVHLKGTQHVGLTDLPYLAPFLLSKLGVTGTMPVARSEQLMSDYVADFFDTYLEGKPRAILARPAPDDVELRAVNVTP